MFKKFGFLVAGLLAGNALAAASAPVWNNTDGAGTIARGGVWYSYGKDNGAVATMTDVAAGKSIAITVSATNESSSGGMGISLAKNDGVKDLSAYAGVCLTYSATQKFRFDVKTSGITDYDYNGMILPAHSKQDTTYIPFSKLAQEGWGDAVSFDASDVQAFQFSYKQSLYADTKTTKNTIVVSSITLGSSCTNHPPVLTSAYAAINGKTVDIAEGATHEIPLADVFVDEDGDELTYTVTMSGAENSVNLLDTAKTFTMKDTLHFATAANPEGDVDVTISAKDTHGNTKAFSFTFHTEDVENAPVAKNFSFEVPEDSSYKSPIAARLSVFGSDADGDKIAPVIETEPAHGTLEVAANGIFTYKPAADFNGKDTFTFKFVETETTDALESNVATCTITVTPVNDAPVVSFVKDGAFEDDNGKEYSYGDTLEVDEDFTAFSILVPAANVTVTDVDGEDDIVVDAKVSGVVTTKFVADGEIYTIEISAIKDANGVAKVSLVAGDHKITKSQVICYVKVNSVIDPPTVKDDEYTIPQDSLFKVAAKNGVLANDVNPDSIEIIAVLDVDPDHGTVVLAEDGSFTYESEPGYEGVDYFGYVVKYGESGETEMGVVTINVVYKNKAPSIVEGVLDTVGTRLASLSEDFVVIKKYTKAEVQSWFEDDQNTAAELTYSVRSDDSLLAPSIASGVISIKSVKDACGEAEVIVTAKDKNGATTDLAIPASIACVNDRPVVLKSDTIFINSDSAFVVKVSLLDYVSDPDGDSLSFAPSVNSRLIVTVEDDSLVLTAMERTKYTMGTETTLTIRASDGKVYTTLTLCVKWDDSKTAITPVIAAPKSTWQNAILANRGVAAMFDMQGRVMWKQKLPVSEAEVRAVAAGVQGRKILMVNKQTYTIK
ncbi:MAG: Ig-like domain-containing protein [Fibrobacter sp.]|nr:Ig-like domain-containing protein [Fibrobacter sp.]